MTKNGNNCWPKGFCFFLKFFLVTFAFQLFLSAPIWKERLVKWQAELSEKEIFADPENKPRNIIAHQSHTHLYVQVPQLMPR